MNSSNTSWWLLEHFFRAYFENGGNAVFYKKIDVLDNV